MTTVVVVKKNGKACIAADSLMGWGGLKQKSEYVADNSKIINLAENYFGISGSSSHKLVMSSYFSKLKKPILLRNKKEIFEAWLRFHRALKDDYHLNPKEDDDDEYESSQIMTLLANPHGIFGIFPLRTVIEFSKFWACGSGMEYALGALHCNYDRSDDVADIARSAVEAAAEFDEGTECPITTHTIELVNDISRSVVSKPTHQSKLQSKK